MFCRSTGVMTTSRPSACALRYSYSARKWPGRNVSCGSLIAVYLSPGDLTVHDRRRKMTVMVGFLVGAALVHVPMARLTAVPGLRLPHRSFRLRLGPVR